MLGVLLAVTAALCWGTGGIFTRLGLQNLKSTTGTLISMFSSVVLVGLLALIVNFDAVRQLSPRAILWFSLIGVVTYFLGRLFNYSSVKHIGVTRASALFASAPLFAILLAVLWLGERVNLPIVLGTLSIVVGVYLVTTSE